MNIEQRGYYMWGASVPGLLCLVVESHVVAFRATTITLRNLMESWGGFAGKALL
jgi:hypothetical protein